VSETVATAQLVFKSAQTALKKHTPRGFSMPIAL